MLPSLRSAFTLIELLVVVTIIVILIALLTPALDRAVYQAQLVVCAANLRGTAGGAHAYAMDHQRRYPYRPGQALNDKPANSLCRGAPIEVNGRIVANNFDTRPYIEGYIPLAMLVEPLAMKLDLSTAHSASMVNMAYGLWFGFTYKTGVDKGLMKLGDRFTWGGRGYSVLAADWDLVHGTDLTHTSHPDLWARNYLVGGQDVEIPLRDGAPMTGLDEQKITYSWWDTSPGIYNQERGPVDLNAAFEDGGVLRYNGVRWNEWAVGEGIAQVPDYPSVSQWPTRYQQLPMR